MRPSKPTINFLQGNIAKLLFLFTWPLIMGEILQSLYNSVDSLVVGNFVSDTALAAVSICSTLSNLVISFFNGMSIGASVIVARSFGKGNQEELVDAISVAITYSVVLGVLLSGAGIIAAPELIRLSGALPDVFGEAVIYLRIYLAGLMFTVIYNMGAGILRAVGNANAPFTILLMTSILNVILDVVFVTIIPLGVAGVGVATVIAQGISVFMVYREFKKMNSNIHIDLYKMLRQRDTVWEISNIGFPSGVQGAVINFSNLFIWRYVNMFDSSVAVAGVGIAQRLDHFAAIPPKAFGSALATFIGQNEGAKNHKRSKRGARYTMWLSLACTMAISVILYTFADVFVGLFNSSPDVISIGVDMMRVLVPFYGIMAIRELFLGILRGYGDAHIPMVLSLAGMVGFRQLFLFFAMRRYHSLMVTYVGYPLAWGVTTLLLAGYYCFKSRIERHKG